MADYDGSERADPHDNGTIWAAALWDLRSRLQATRAAGEDAARACDKLVLKSLLLLGAESGATAASSAPTVKAMRHARASFAVALDALLRADELVHDGAFRNSILDCFARRGIAGGASPRHTAVQVATDGDASRASADGSVAPHRRAGVELHSGWEESPRALAELEASRARLLRHVPAEDLVETRDLFARGELGARLRALGEPPLSVLATGDTMLGGRSLALIEERGLEYPFRALRPLLRRAAIVLGNLEGPIAVEAHRQPRNFSYRVEPRMAIALKRAGFHVMNLANNHLTDCGRRGVLETIDVLTRAGIAPLGAGVDERAAHQPVVLQANGLRIGFLGYYWNRRTAARADVAGSAMDPPEALEADIGRLRERTDRVVVTFHWGVPYVREPSPEDRVKARHAIDCGADAVIGHHVHVIQPFELHRGRPIFYGIGNCAFGSGNSKAEGLLVGLTFEAQRTRLFVYALNVKNRDPRVDYQPKVLRGDAARRYLGRLVEISGSDGRELNLEEFRATLDLPWTASVRDLASERGQRN